MVRTKDKLNEKETRSIIFLDTPDHTLRRNGLVLRQRAVDEAVEYTLKCRSEDRYFAAGTDVGAADRLKSDPKLEEDIAPPFRGRFSHSTTITVAGDRKTTLHKDAENPRRSHGLLSGAGHTSRRRSSLRSRNDPGGGEQ